MDIHSILAELRAEKDRLEEAILTIERLAVGSLTKRRGRPPKWLASMKAANSPTASAEEPKKRRSFSAATRKKMAAAQRKRWAAVHNKAAATAGSKGKQAAKNAAPPKAKEARRAHVSAAVLTSVGNNGHNNLPVS